MARRRGVLFRVWVGAVKGEWEEEGSIVMTLQKMLIYMPEAHLHGRPQGCTETKACSMFISRALRSSTKFW